MVDDNGYIFQLKKGKMDEIKLKRDGQNGILCF